MKKYQYFFSHARSALKYILIQENPNLPFEILLPDYICESVPNTLYQIDNIKISYYKINLDLSINWDNLILKVNDNTKYILVVNYFGFPIDILKANKFCKEHNIVLIEDNTHGYNGFFNNKLLGHYGDIGISSPRKHIPLKFGGTLYYSRSNLNINQSIYTTTNFDKIKFLINDNFRFRKIQIQNFFKPKIKQITVHFEDKVNISKLDKYSMKIINNKNWNKIKKDKFCAYKSWQDFFLKINKKPLIDIGKFKDVNPWAFPVLLNSKEEVIEWFNWSKNKNVLCFTWPTLHPDISKTSNAYQLSQKIICFSTYTRLGNV